MMKEPIVLESNQNHATITNSGICPTLSACMGMGGGYIPMIVVQRRFSNVNISNVDKSPCLEAGAGCGGNNVPMVLARGSKMIIINSIGGQSECAFDSNVAPTLKQTHYKSPPCVCLTEKRFFEWHEDDVAVTLRNRSGSYGGGSEVLVIDRREMHHNDNDE